VAKRRFRASPEPAPEALSAEERRNRRRRDRELIRRGKKPPTGRSSGPWRRVLLIGVPTVVIVAVVAVLLFSNLLQAPCINFEGIPEESGPVDFPLHNTTDFTGTWCPSDVTNVEQIYPLLKISIEGQSVGIPPTQAATAQNPDWPSIGRNSSYPGGYACVLPIATHPPDASGGYPDGIIEIASPWPYSYNLSDFFHVWSTSFSSVSVNSSAPSQPIIYQPGDLLGYTADASHSIGLFVDGRPSSAGPGLVLNTLDYASGVYPSCLAKKYGTGHTILLSYTAVAPSARGAGLHPATLSTAGADPAIYEAGFGGTLQKVVDAPAKASDAQRDAALALGWLTLRPPGA